MKNPVKLSICIPTYNRSGFLRRSLEYYREQIDFPFTYEIVISDNASTDDTREVVESFIAAGLPINYVRRSVNGGYEPNLISALRLARGEYAIYVGDDDRLIVSGVSAAVAYLDRNADISACYAPWYLYNEIEDRDNGTFYSVPEDTKFAQRDFRGVFEFIVKRHIFPEVYIYRSAALRSAMVPRQFCYWAFSHLGHFLDSGAVVFLKEPFYRAVIESAHRDRAQAGHEETMTSWDRYRGGLEYLLYMGVRRGSIDLGGGTGLEYDKLVRQFTFSRMIVALKLWLGRSDYMRAYELYVRLVMNGFGQHPDVQNLRERLPRMVALQTLAGLVNATAGIDRLILHGITNKDAVEGVLRRLGLKEEVEIVEEIEIPSQEDLDRTAVLVPGDGDRSRYLEKGYIPNLILKEADIVAPVLV